MNRCLKSARTLFFIAACACLAPAGMLFSSETLAQNQTQRGRVFPQKTQRGTMQFLALQEVSLDGATEPLTPGARVHNELNMLVLTSSLIGQTYTVNYLRDPMGVIREVWLLTPFETTLQPDGSLAPATGPTEKLYGG